MTGATEALGIAAVLEDFGHPVKIRLRSDATAAIGMVAREGLGKVRHLATADLWIQQRVRRGDLIVSKWPGKENPADLGTKPLDAETIRQHLSRLGFEPASGRATVAPQLKSEAGRH